MPIRIDPSFSAPLRRVDKNVLIEFRMATADIHTEIQRDSELEAAMAGQSLPLSEREERILESAVNRMASFRSDSSIEKRITMELAKGFLLRASVEGAPLKNPLSESGAEIFH